MESWVIAETVRWGGHAWVGPGIGHQEWHLHQEHKISVGLDSTVSVQTPMDIQTGCHFHSDRLETRLSAGQVLSIYVDALSEEAMFLPPTDPRLIKVTGALRRSPTGRRELPRW